MTQGMVTIRQSGWVKMKIVAGLNGMKAAEVAQAVRSLNRIPSFEEAERIAIGAGFGSEECRVIITSDDCNPPADDLGDELYARCRRTFSDPRFNPRWELGTAAYIEVVDL